MIHVKASMNIWYCETWTFYPQSRILTNVFHAKMRQSNFWKRVENLGIDNLEVDAKKYYPQLMNSWNGTANNGLENLKAVHNLAARIGERELARVLKNWIGSWIFSTMDKNDVYW